MGSGKQGKNRSSLVVAIFLLLICGRNLDHRGTPAAEKVESVCEYIYRLRPLAEWTPFRHGVEHYDPKQFLIMLLPALARFQRSNPRLLQQCTPVTRLIGLPVALKNWMERNGDRNMAQRRARLYFKSRGCGPLAAHHVAFVRPGSRAIRRCRHVSLMGVIAAAIAVPSSAHIRHTISLHQQISLVAAT